MFVRWYFLAVAWVTPTSFELVNGVGG